MKLSIKSQYAIASLVYMGLNDNIDKFISLGEISQKFELSKIYLEQVFALLKKSDFIIATKGPYGGYKLTKKPKDITLYDILTVTETSLFNTNENSELDNNIAITFVHQEINTSINQSLQKISLEDLIEKTTEPNLMYYI